jgi:hypothetical protein
MAGWQTLPGQTLLVPSGPSGLHLFVLVLGPVTFPGYGSTPQIAMVSATTLREGIPHDPACVLEPGDHPFIQHRSFISYRHLRLDTDPHVGRMVDSAVWSRHEPCTPALLQRIVAGVCLSKLTPREYKRLFGCLGAQ